jgi:hypothetical protein
VIGMLKMAGASSTDSAATGNQDVGAAYFYDTELLFDDGFEN